MIQIIPVKVPNLIAISKTIDKLIPDNKPNNQPQDSLINENLLDFCKLKIFKRILCDIYK